MGPSTDQNFISALAPPFRLALTAGLVLLGGCSLWHASRDNPQPPASEQPPGQVVDPGIARREVKIPKIHARNFEFGAYTGVLSVQDLQSNLTYGARAAYHVTEDFFLEAEYGRSSVSDQIRREIGQPFFSQEVIDLSNYGINLGYNVLPGEVFFGSRHAMTSTFYLLAGAGNTNFNNEDFLTYNVGFGLKVLPIDRLSIRLEARDRMWNSDLLGTKEFTNNLETTLGLAYYF